MYRVLLRVNKSVLAACFQLFHCKDSLNLSVIHSVGGKINYKLSFCLQLPVAGCCFVSHQHSFAYNLESNRRPKRRFASVGNLFTCHRVPCSRPGRWGRMQYAPTRTSDNGRCRSFAPEMFSDCGGCLSGAIVLGHEHGGRMQYAPTRTSDNGRCRSFAPVGNLFIGHRVPLAGRVGAYCIRPIKCPRRGQIQRWRSTPIRL